MPRTFKQAFEIPLSDLSGGLLHGRGVDSETDELAASILRMGQLDPIVVGEAGETGKREIISGYRRYLAVKQLGWSKMLAIVSAGIL